MEQPNRSQRHMDTTNIAKSVPEFVAALIQKEQDTL
ncbi:hypothetical protein SAMN05216243_2377 [Sediminibacillus albus]|uniref:Uncharacterized protein n=1 Tax=Sediminibacillus albus TaxID=407036 RepID=A0A1G9A419_9BACI|nr:hypothetical protein SAMN05216243_2377 [Sediminibacillus albus]